MVPVASRRTSRRTRGGGAAVRAPAVLVAVLAAILAGSALLAGCGGSGPVRTGGQGASRPASPSASRGPSLAERVCGGARQAAARTLGSTLTARIVSPAPASLECVLTGR